jgi:hypothetical protein
MSLRIVSEIERLISEHGSYNDNRPPEQPIQTVFDFTYDLAELALPA